MTGVLYLLSGPAKTGKTTWSRQAEERFGDKIERVEDSGRNLDMTVRALLADDKVVMFETLREPERLSPYLLQTAHKIYSFGPNREPVEVTIAEPDLGPLYPEIEVQLSGEDRNGFSITSRVRMAIEKHIKSVPLIEGEDDLDEVRVRGLRRNRADAIGREFMDEALAGNYDELIQTCMKWVTVK